MQPLPILGLGLVLSLGLGFSDSSDAALPTTVRVDLFQAHRPFNEIKLTGPLRVLQPIQQTLGQGVYRVSLSQGKMALISGSNAAKGSRMILVKTQNLVIATLGTGTMTLQPPGIMARRYPGRLEFQMTRHNTLHVVNEISVRDYVILVVGSETPPGWPTEALKAQAVLTQTRLTRYHRGDILNDTTQEEVYFGDTHRRQDVSKAVNLVWGQVLTIHGLPLTAFYHASCAGHTSDTQVFGRARHLPGIVGVPCTACRASTFAKPMTTMISQNAFYKAFPTGLPQVLSKDRAGRPLTVRFPNGKTESGYAFWLSIGQKLGWDKAPGLRFSWAQQPDGRVMFTSSGAGHGVGLCQQGAAKLAQQGESYRQILHYYFPQAQLSQK